MVLFWLFETPPWDKKGVMTQRNHHVCILYAAPIDRCLSLRDISNRVSYAIDAFQSHTDHSQSCSQAGILQLNSDNLLSRTHTVEVTEDWQPLSSIHRLIHHLSPSRTIISHGPDNHTASQSDETNPSKQPSRSYSANQRLCYYRSNE